MLDLTEKTTDMNHIRFHIIPSKKFKTINVVVKCKAPLNRDTMTKRALIPYLLQQGTSKFPSEKQLMLKLDEMYGAILSIDGIKKGNDHIISFRLEIANEKFIHNETTVIDESFQLLKDILFDPYVENNAFPERVVTREKVTLKSKINSIYDDKLAYANMRLIEEMCKGETYSIHPYGYEDDLDNIDAENMYSYYKTMLAEDRMDIYVIGDFDVEDMEKQITTVFHRRSSNKEHSAPWEENKRQKVKEIVDTQPIQQAKLHIGYRTNCTYKDDDYFALQLFNGLFGSFPSSKLFKNVREKHSLAYYASSRIESHKGLLVVFSGIEASDYKQARDIIELQMQAMKEGDFTHTEVEEAKELIISEVRETLDHPQGIVELLYQQVIAQKEISPQTFIDQIKKVSLQDIIQIAEKIELDTVYLLTSESTGEQNG